MDMFLYKFQTAKVLLFSKQNKFFKTTNKNIVYFIHCSIPKSSKFSPKIERGQKNEIKFVILLSVLSFR